MYGVTRGAKDFVDAVDACGVAGNAEGCDGIQAKIDKAGNVGEIERAKGFVVGNIEEDVV